MPYFWAAYKYGCFKNLNGGFIDGLTKDRLSELLENYISDNNLTPFSIFANIDGKKRIIGIALFFIRGRLMETSDIIWFPWATKRLILEGYVNFVNSIRKQSNNDMGQKYVIIEYAQEKDVKFFDHVCSYGIMRRVGTSYELYHNEKCCIYESRGFYDVK